MACLRSLILSICLPLLFTATSIAQQTRAQFNHAFIVLDSSDYDALLRSQFIQDEFSGFFTRSSVTNTSSWTGAYIFGDKNYVEFFGPSGSQHKVGDAAMAFGFDRIGEIYKMQTILNKNYNTTIETRQRKMNDSLVAWFDALYITDSVFFAQSHIETWFMEYRKEYFLFNKFPASQDLVSRKNYLLQHADKRKGKYLSEFTGITFYATEAEINYYSSLLLRSGFKQMPNLSFKSTEGFIIDFQKRTVHTKYAIKSFQFSTTTPVFKDIEISNGIHIHITGNKGEINFAAQ